jgi:phosphate starvation-inducible PhoH-like protein
MVVTGDPTQDDLPPGTISGLIDAVAKLDRIETIGMVRFTNRDIVRHPLVEAILDAYHQESERSTRRIDRATDD